MKKDKLLWKDSDYLYYVRGQNVRLQIVDGQWGMYKWELICIAESVEKAKAICNLLNADAKKKGINDNKNIVHGH